MLSLNMYNTSADPILNSNYSGRSRLTRLATELQEPKLKES